MTQGHHPNMLEEDELRRNGLFCFKDNGRPCGADCMAFSDPPEGADYQGKQWANCMELVYMHRAGKHLTILANAGAQMARQAKIEADDQKRTNQPSPPTVR